MEMEEEKRDEYFKGRGAQIKTGNKFLKNEYVTDHIEVGRATIGSASNTNLFRIAQKDYQQNRKPGFAWHVFHESVPGM